MSEYKGYDPEVGKKSSMKYIKEKQHSILVRWKKTEYEQEILPVIEASGLGPTAYIKKAVKEKIERDNNGTMDN